MDAFKNHPLRLWLSALLMFALTILGVIKIFVGVFRHKPVGILFSLIVITGIIGFAFSSPSSFLPKGNNRSNGSGCSGGCGGGCGGGGGCGSCGG